MICLVGDILTDVTLPSPSQKEYKMRLGGVVHAARGLWAMGVDYAVAYFAPAYIDGQIESYLHEIGCREIHKIGNVTGCPYTMLIREAKEIGNQGYEFLYRDCIKIEYADEIYFSCFFSLIIVSKRFLISSSLPLYLKL